MPSFVSAPVLAAPLAQHVFILWRAHRGDVHARGIVPAEEGLVCLLRFVAIGEVDDVGGDFLVHGLRALQGQRTFVLAHLVLGGAIGGSSSACTGRRWRQA